MRVSTAFSRLLDLPGVWVRSVCFEPDRVVLGGFKWSSQRWLVEAIVDTR